MSTPKLTDEQRQAIHSHLREQLQAGLKQANRGELAEWDLEEFLAKMHRQHAKPTAGGCN